MEDEFDARLPASGPRMAGSDHIPLFGNLTRGTLFGRWPDIGLWPVILSLANRVGLVDATHEYIAACTGSACRK